MYTMKVFLPQESKALKQIKFFHLFTKNSFNGFLFFLMYISIKFSCLYTFTIVPIAYLLIFRLLKLYFFSIKSFASSV
ncbi:hypothetical protein COD89_28645 [Bacillus thuringiensis]|nr:hypothetical protein COD89_28645 [Bacillus thuringiensis]